MERKDSDYISLVCNYDREGLRHLGKHLLSLLDWRSLVRLKRASRQVWYFLQQVPHLEKQALASKLAQDWGSGSPRVKKTLPSPAGPYQEKVLATRMLGRSVLVSTERAIHLLPEGIKFLTAEQEERREPSNKMSSRSEESEIRHFDLLNNWLVAGGSNGILSVWDLKTAKLVSSRQLFGMITGLRCLPDEQLIATSHASKAYDCGVISVRRMISPTETEVVWSATHEVMPIFCFDINTRWLVSLEWLGFFNGTPVGSAAVYSRQGTLYHRRDLGPVRAVETRRSVLGLQRSASLRFTAAALLKDDFLALAIEYDPTGRAAIEIWELTSLSPLKRLPGHTHSIHQLTVAGDILLSRDKEGNVSIWDARADVDEEVECHGRNPRSGSQLLHFLRVQQKAIYGTNIDMRHLVMASPTGVAIMDFWDAADVKNDLVANVERGATALKEDENEVAGNIDGAIGAQIQKLADFKETLIFK